MYVIRTKILKIQQRRDLTLVLLEEILFLSIITSEKGKNKKTSQKTVWVECVICNVHNMSHLLSIAAIDTQLRKMLKSSLNEEAFCP